MFRKILPFYLAIVLPLCGLAPAQAAASLPDGGEINAETVLFFNEAVRSLWDADAESEAYISAIELTLGSGSMIVDGEETTVTPPLTADGGIVLPIADIAEALGVEIEMDMRTESVPLCSLEEAAGILGVDVFASGGDIVLTRPFQTKTLLVRMLPGKSLPAAYANYADDCVTDGKGQYVLKYGSIHQAKESFDAIKSLPDCQNIAPQLIASSFGKFGKEDGKPALERQEASWGTGRIRADMMKEYLTSTGKTGANLVVAVLDTGADSNHPHLSGRMLLGRNFSETNATDQGWTVDGDGHGTHVSGTVVDCTTENVKIMPVKVLDDYGYGFDTDIAAGIVWAADNGAKIINMSLGSTYYGDEPDWDWLMREACEYATGKGTCIVVAAGNDNKDTKYVSPARLASVITVAATDISDQKASFSNFGDAVDVSAPGVNISSSIPGGGYGYYDGTSMASPHVAAAAAMFSLNEPSLGPEGLRAAVRASAVDLGVTGWDRLFGSGVIDFRKFLGAAEIPVDYFSLWPESVTIENSLFASQPWLYVNIGWGDATDKSFTVASSDDRVAAYIDGRIAPVGVGEAVLTFSTANGFSSTCSVTVVKSLNWLDYAAFEYAGGKGSESDPYLIATPEQLAKLSYEVGVNRNLCWGEYFKLASDIDLEGKYWSPIHYVEINGWFMITDGFMGHFDGGNHSVSNMEIIRMDTLQTSSHVGLFGEIGVPFDRNAKCSVKNLAVLDAKVDGTGWFGPAVGIICGYVGAGATISNCFTTGTVSGGGIMGCGAATIENCFSSADTFSLNADDGAGGLATSLTSYFNEVSANVYNSYSSGSILSLYPDDSGFAAYAGGEEISNSFSTVYAPYGCGFSSLKTHGSARGCYYLEDNPIGIREVFAGTEATVAPKGMDFFTSRENYLNPAFWDSEHPWDFVDVWGINENFNNGLPYLKSFPVTFYTGSQVFKSIITPGSVTGVLSGSPKTAQGLGLPKTISIVTDELPYLEAVVSWDAEGSSYDPSNPSAQTFNVKGNVIMPQGVANPSGIPLSTSIQVSVEAVMGLDGVTPPAAITGIPNGAEKSAKALKLPATVNIAAGNFQQLPATVLWFVEGALYDPSIKTEQVFQVDGIVILPNGVQNTQGIPLEISVSVTVDKSDKWVDFAADSFDGGNGTAGNPYLIARAEQLAKLSRDVDAGNSYKGQYFKLTADIDLGGLEWMPIGQSNWYVHPFSGNFDGNCHSVSNMKIVPNFDFSGLFGHCEGSRIENLAVINADVEFPLWVGNDGILCGIAFDTQFSNCYTTGKSPLGGFAGGIFGNSVVRDCFSAATTGNGASHFAAGFISSVNNSQVYNSYASGQVESIGEISAGFSYDLFGDSMVVNSFATNKQQSGIGFIKNKDSSTLDNCYYLKDNLFGIAYDELPELTDLAPKEMSFFKDKQTYTNQENWSSISPWDFERIWGIDEGVNNGLPYLKTLPLPPKPEEPPIPSSVTVRAFAAPGGSVSGGGEFSYGDRVTVAAAPDAGCRFEGWYENQKKVAGAGAVYSFSADADRVLQARFSVHGTYIEEFPDPAFRREALRLINDIDGGRRTEDDFIKNTDMKPMASLTHLFVYDMGIRDLTGLKFFPNLQYLYCQCNELTELDISNNPALEFVCCFYNNMASPDSVIGWRELGLVINSPEDMGSGTLFFYPKELSPNQNVKASIRTNPVSYVADETEFILSIRDAQGVMVIELKFELDGSMLTFMGIDELNGFSQSGNILWELANGNIWMGKITIAYGQEGSNGFTSEAPADIAKLIFTPKATGDASVKLTGISVYGRAGDAATYLDAVIEAGEATTAVERKYSKYDLTRDGLVDALDLGIMLLYCGSDKDSPNWDTLIKVFDSKGKGVTASMCDVNSDGKVDMLDLIDLFIHYTK